MNDKVQEIRKALEVAALGPWKSDHDWMFVIDGNDRNANIIANAPEWLSYLLSELDAAEKYKRLYVNALEELDAAKQGRSDIVEIKNHMQTVYEREIESLHQRLKQAIEALGEINGMHYIWQIHERAKQSLSLLQEETENPPYMAHGSLGSLLKRPDTAPTSLGGSVGTMKLRTETKE